MIVIDATNMILGRMATFAAKQALLGQEVKVINAEKAVVSGARAKVLKDTRQKMDRGVPLKGPYIPRMADRYVRRTIRGMLPHRQAKGAEAFKRVMCYVGVPEELANEKPVTIAGAAASKLPTFKYVSVQDIVKFA